MSIVPIFSSSFSLLGWGGWCIHWFIIKVQSQTDNRLWIPPKPEKIHINLKTIENISLLIARNRIFQTINKMNDNFKFIARTIRTVAYWNHANFCFKEWKIIDLPFQMGKKRNLRQDRFDLWIQKNCGFNFPPLNVPNLQTWKPKLISIGTPKMPD